MITNNDIADAIAALVEDKFPGETFYRGYAPANFQRPSTLLEQSGGKIFPNFGCGSVEVQPTLLGLFLPGYVRVGDRAPHVLDEGELENGLDFASVTVTLSYTLSRQEFMELQQLPQMGGLNFEQEE